MQQMMILIVEFSTGFMLLFINSSLHTYLWKWFQIPAPCFAKAPSIKAISKTSTEAVSPVGGW
jgi:hypothetical protein